jgi:hypothetical protein
LAAPSLEDGRCCREVDGQPLTGQLSPRVSAGER